MKCFVSCCRILGLTFTMVRNLWRAFNIMSFKGICLDFELIELIADKGGKGEKEGRPVWRLLQSSR